MAAPQFIYHIASVSDWKAQVQSSEYSNDSLEEEGFIHCSKYEQLEGTLKRFFENREDILILKMDTKMMNVPVIYEAADDGSGFFPHVFGVIQKKAVMETLSFPFNFLINPPQTKA
ncbi:MAG: DUF952 domain-containing protein [Bacteroidia bacterium]